MSFSDEYFAEMSSIISLLDTKKIEGLVKELETIRSSKGRVFFLGVGGSAANSQHAVNDFRKLASFEAYAPTDNVAEITARTNDEGWDTVFVEWLKGSNLNSSDCIFILSVGGGNLEKRVSVNICNAILLAKKIGSKIFGIVGKMDGFTYKNSDCCILIPLVNEERITPHAESFQAAIWHLLVSHPILNTNKTKW
jgi:D-sedoheptulose 7-phosphate isomerase